MLKEIVYLAHDNAIDLQLKVDGAAVDLAPVTRIVVRDLGCAWEADSAVTAAAFDWAAGGGVLKLRLGDEPIPPGSYTCYIILYDPANPDGVVWDKVGIKTVAVCAVPVAGP